MGKQTKILKDNLCHNIKISQIIDAKYSFENIVKTIKKLLIFKKDDDLQYIIFLKVSFLELNLVNY